MVACLARDIYVDIIWKKSNQTTELSSWCFFSSPLKDAKIDPEEFTGRLQSELKSSPQPYLVPFLKVMWTLFRCINICIEIHVLSFWIYFLNGISFSCLEQDYSIFTLCCQFLLKSWLQVACRVHLYQAGQVLLTAFVLGAVAVCCSWLLPDRLREW